MKKIYKSIDKNAKESDDIVSEENKNEKTTDIKVKKMDVQKVLKMIVFVNYIEKLRKMEDIEVKCSHTKRIETVHKG